MTEEARKLADLLTEAARHKSYWSIDDQALVLRAATALRSQSGTLAREEVARIIDPIAFSALTTRPPRKTLQKMAFEKADAILALTPSHEAGTQEPVAWPQERTPMQDQIKYMVDRFLGWKLPESFNPDAGISFKRSWQHYTPYSMPSGTNLLDAPQAEAMVRYLLSGLPVASTDQVAVAAREEAERFYEKGDDTRFDRAAFVDGANFGARLAAPASQDATRVLTEDQLTILVTKARGKFVNLGQETLDGCSMERFIARELLASPARADDGEKAAFLNKFCQSNGEEA